MGETPYHATFSAGASIRVESRAVLDAFKRDWRYHNPLTDEQLVFAGVRSHVNTVGFYHGGEPLYTLVDAPGVWHEQCLLAD